MGNCESLRRKRKSQEMNIAKVKEALADAKKEKRHAEADGNSNYAYWSGYEDGVLMALFHMEEKSK